MPLTDLKIKNLKPKDKPYKVPDFDGLYVLVNPNGSRLWRVKYRLRGKERLLSLGAYPAITLLQAPNCGMKHERKLPWKLIPVK